MTIFETACKNYTALHGGRPPDTLMELVAPSDGTKPMIEGGPNVLIGPFDDGAQYQYDPNHKDSEARPIRS
jgi:hypothetical protein